MKNTKQISNSTLALSFLSDDPTKGAGLGFFTAIELQPDDIIGRGDVMIPLTDQTYHLRGLGMDMIQRDDWAYIDPTADYLWNGVGLGMHRETAHPNDGEHEFVAGKLCSRSFDASDLIYENGLFAYQSTSTTRTGYAPGMDAVINCHLALTNVDKNYPRYDFVGLHRSRDPGVGAFTPYHGCETYATERVPIGGEIFKVNKLCATQHRQLLHRTHSQLDSNFQGLRVPLVHVA
jgi:hypothetical protein